MASALVAVVVGVASKSELLSFLVDATTVSSRRRDLDLDDLCPNPLDGSAVHPVTGSLQQPQIRMTSTFMLVLRVGRRVCTPPAAIMPPLSLDDPSNKDVAVILAAGSGSAK